MKIWSEYQNNIFNFAVNGVGNAIVEAVAGSGKTTTIVETLNRISASSIFLAFNKPIAEELKARGVNARTFHSLTYMPVTKFKNTKKVEIDKLRILIDQNMKGSDRAIYGSYITKLVSLGRQTGVGCLVPDTENVWIELIEHYNLESEHEEFDVKQSVKFASELLKWSNNSNLVDFDDLLYLAVKEGIGLPKFDFVFVDEAQDTNAIQRAILRKIMKKGTRLIAVGDPAQAIYGFRGSDSNSLDLIAEEFECVKLPLTVSYRCPTSVVIFAKNWVSHIEAAPDAEEGKVNKLGKNWNNEMFQANDLVVCRTTKPLISLAFRLIKDKIPAYVMGREIGQGLVSLIRKMGSKDVDKMCDRLNDWTDREIEKALAKKQEGKIEAIQDKSDTILCLVEGLEEDDRTISCLINTIEYLFSDKSNAVKLATIHKAKGLEADRVYWLNSSQCPAKWAKMEWQRQQEMNLCYVATTRAKQELNLIEE